jgi:hypothetical protein
MIDGGLYGGWVQVKCWRSTCHINRGRPARGLHCGLVPCVRLCKQLLCFGADSLQALVCPCAGHLFWVTVGALLPMCAHDSRINAYKWDRAHAVFIAMRQAAVGVPVDSCSHALPNRLLREWPNFPRPPRPCRMTCCRAWSLHDVVCVAAPQSPLRCVSRDSAVEATACDQLHPNLTIVQRNKWMFAVHACSLMKRCHPSLNQFSLSSGWLRLGPSLLLLLLLPARAAKRQCARSRPAACSPHRRWFQHNCTPDSG